LVDENEEIEKTCLDMKVNQSPNGSSINHNTVQNKYAAFTAMKFRSQELVRLLIQNIYDKFTICFAKWIHFDWCVMWYCFNAITCAKEQEEMLIKVFEYGFATTKRNMDFIFTKRIEDKKPSAKLIFTIIHGCDILVEDKNACSRVFLASFLSILDEIKPMICIDSFGSDVFVRTLPY